MELKIGQKVRGIRVDSKGADYTGVVYSIKGTDATIKRDDGEVGTGESISEFPYNGECGFVIHRKPDSTWGSNCDNGLLETIGKAKPAKPVKFLLRYERDLDSEVAARRIEEFNSLIEAKNRVKKLFEDSTTRKDSLKIYEIKRIYEVKVENKIKLV